jgi:TetR/AcrR family transcriptional repressor of bet genes
VNSATRTPPARRRTASKEQRRLQLIRATIRSVAKNGLSDTTMATVAREAKLSQGIINLHFQSKDRLLVETLRYLAGEYREAWQNALDRAVSSRAAQLEALVAVDFGKPVCDRNKLAVWFAFWGETKSRPIYRQICAELDRQYDAMLVELCQAIKREGGYREVNAETVAKGLAAMSEGLWLDLLMTPESMDQEQAKSICLAYLDANFPSYFNK